jgi:hypothetical protein
MLKEVTHLYISSWPYEVYNLIRRQIYNKNLTTKNHKT